jgi:isocitrate lyase
MVSKETLERMSDESRFPTDEVSALVYKALLQHCVEMDFLDGLVKRQEAGEHLDYDTEVAALEEAQRQVHLEVKKRFPDFKYANELSYSFNQEEGQPQFLSVNEEGKAVPFTTRHDLNRDDVVHRSMEQIFKNHMMVFENGEYEFCWEFSNRDYTVTYKHLPDEGQLLH